MRKVVVSALTAFAMAYVVPAGAQGPELSIGPNGRILEGGHAVHVSVTASCPEGEEVLEAFVYVTQGGNQSRFAGVSVTCNGRRQPRQVRVAAQDFLFQRGSVRASGYMLLASGASTSPSREIQLH